MKVYIMKLPLGKIPPEILATTVFKFVGAKRNDVIVGPSQGEDAAIISDGCKLLALHCDPISGADEKIGWIAMNVATNDIATRGVKPRWALSCVMLPKGSNTKLLEKICKEMSAAAEELGVSIVGGHSEITLGINHPLVIVFSLGVVEDGYVTSSGAKPGSKIILTKSAGIEGTAILALDRRDVLLSKYGKTFVKTLLDYTNKLSILKEAMKAFEVGGVQAMHDPTEGGIANGLHEVMDASKTGFRVYEDKIRVSKETLEICRLFGLNPLNLISSGSLLIIASKEKATMIVEQLKITGIKAAIIGDVLADETLRVIVKKDGAVKPLIRPISDELWKALSKEF
jgi:hydrogenase maturation factor